ncbi:hypothetical protein BH11BAC2_BH11BAC2_00410 [soil metagenome]
MKTNRFKSGSLKQKQAPKLRLKLIAAYSVAVAFCVGITTFLYFSNSTSSQAAPGLHGSKTVTTANAILNEYTALLSDVNSGSTTLSVSNSRMNSNSRFVGNLAAGELIMIIQMQGADITTNNSNTYGSVSNYNNCGKYEFVEVSSIPNNNTITLSTPLSKSYTANGNVQVIRVPRYTSFTVNAGASVTSTPWNGTIGGIVAIESNNAMVINGTIDVSGDGFKGGSKDNNTNYPGDRTVYRTANNADGAEKGESIAGGPSALNNGRYGRGAPANGGGGGNAAYAGGGGGSNTGSGTWSGMGDPATPNTNWTNAWNLEGASFATSVSPGGGRGGYSWSMANKNPITNPPGSNNWNGDVRYNVGGFGGRPLDTSTGRIFMGGGGGAGDADNTADNSANGGDGGGIVFLLSGGNVSGTGSITANGDHITTANSAQGNGVGGAGGGGTIIIYTPSGTVSNLTLFANGGNGGSQTITNPPEAEGPGGGGGGGFINTSNATNLTRTVNGGNGGTTSSSPMANFTANGATQGSAGTISTSVSNPYTTNTPLPVALVSFTGEEDPKGVRLKWATASETDNRFFTLESGTDGKVFRKIAKINGAGNSNLPLSYDFVDEQSVGGLNYYRLSQTDFNGKTEMLKTITISKKKLVSSSQSFDISMVNPTVFTSSVEFTLDSKVVQDVQLMLYNQEGKLFKTQKQTLTTGMQMCSFTGLESLASGTYLIVATAANAEKVTVRIQKAG